MAIAYRPEIDGLRALSIWGVILFHAEFVFNGARVLTGGFVGVDVFFVISGYLISSLIIKDLKANKFKLVDFYERRARRILPVLLTVIIATTPFVFLFLQPSLQVEYAQSVLSILGFASNMWFWIDGICLAEYCTYRPLLHSWSLAVEEQFYLLFPLALVFVWKVARHRLLLITGIALLLSLALAETLVLGYNCFDFYALITRSWELLAGVCLALMEHKYGRAKKSSISMYMPPIGLYLICASMVMFGSATPHPSLFTAIPVVGAMLIIWFARKGEIVTELLSTKLFTSVGLISYSLYLWHYPVLSFLDVARPSASSLDKALWIGVSFALSIFSYFMIEKPVRFNKRVFTRKRFCIGILALIFVIASVQVAALNGLTWSDHLYYFKAPLP